MALYSYTFKQMLNSNEDLQNMYNNYVDSKNDGIHSENDFYAVYAMKTFIETTYALAKVEALRFLNSLKD